MAKKKVPSKALLRGLRMIAKELAKDKERKHREIEEWKARHGCRVSF